MNDLSPIAKYLCEQIDIASEHITSIASETDHASTLIVDALLNDKKLLVCGLGFANPIAQIISSAFMDQYEFERPGFPAINIGLDSLNSDTSSANMIAKQIQAMGMESDVLVLISIGDEHKSFEEALTTAQEKGIKTLLINGSEDATNYMTDALIKLPTNSISNGLQLAIFACNALIKSVESKLFGAAL